MKVSGTLKSRPQVIDACAVAAGKIAVVVEDFGSLSNGDIVIGTPYGLMIIEKDTGSTMSFIARDTSPGHAHVRLLTEGEELVLRCH